MRKPSRVSWDIRQSRLISGDRGIRSSTKTQLLISLCRARTPQQATTPGRPWSSTTNAKRPRSSPPRRRRDRTPGGWGRCPPVRSRNGARPTRRSSSRPLLREKVEGTVGGAAPISVLQRPRDPRGEGRILQPPPAKWIRDTDSALRGGEPHRPVGSHRSRGGRRIRPPVAIAVDPRGTGAAPARIDRG